MFFETRCSLITLTTSNTLQTFKVRGSEVKVTARYNTSPAKTLQVRNK